MKVPFSPPDITDLEINEVIDTLKSGWITTGKKTKLFEDKIAEYCGTSKAACLNSATAALEMTLRILGIGKGDEVITSAYTYTASASVIDHVGAKIVLVDVAPGSFHLDCDKLKTAITDKTKAIIPVDIGGVMCDYDKLYDVLEEKKDLYHPSDNKYQKLFDRPIVVADSAHSFGSLYKGKKCGSIADFTCFSFHAVKNLTTAEGGAITWVNKQGLDNEELYRELMLISLHGQSKDAFSKMQLGAWEYDVLTTGYKCNMTDIMASIGLAQLKRYKELLNRRKQIIEIYDKILLPLGVERIEHFGKDYEGNAHLYLVRIPGITCKERNEIIQRMANAEITCNVHFKPLPLLTAYKNLGFVMDDYPNSYKQYENEITLPLNTLLSNDDATYVAETLASILKDDITQNLG